jgi:hypothetical protein
VEKATRVKRRVIVSNLIETIIGYELPKFQKVVLKFPPR